MAESWREQWANRLDKLCAPDMQPGDTIYSGPIAGWPIGENAPHEDAVVKAFNEWWQAVMEVPASGIALFPTKAVEEIAKLTEQDKPD